MKRIGKGIADVISDFCILVMNISFSGIGILILATMIAKLADKSLGEIVALIYNLITDVEGRLH